MVCLFKNWLDEVSLMPKGQLRTLMDWISIHFHNQPFIELLLHAKFGEKTSMKVISYFSLGNI